MPGGGSRGSVCVNHRACIRYVHAHAHAGPVLYVDVRICICRFETLYVGRLGKSSRVATVLLLMYLSILGGKARRCIASYGVDAAKTPLSLIVLPFCIEPRKGVLDGSI